MTTINLRGKDYQISDNITSLQLKPVARFIYLSMQEAEEDIPDGFFIKVLKTFKYILIDNLPDEFIEIVPDFPLKGFHLEVDEMQEIYVACVKKLKEKKIFEDLDFDSEDSDDSEDDKQNEIRLLEEKLAELKQ